MLVMARSSGLSIAAMSAECPATALRHVRAEGGEYDKRGNGNDDGQPGRPSGSEDQTAAGQNMGEAGREVEPEHERKDVAGGFARTRAADERRAARPDRGKAEQDRDGPAYCMLGLSQRLARTQCRPTRHACAP